MLRSEMVDYDDEGTVKAWMEAERLLEDEFLFPDGEPRPYTEQDDGP